jgi:hypothetical protein
MTNEHMMKLYMIYIIYNFNFIFFKMMEYFDWDFGSKGK